MSAKESAHFFSKSAAPCGSAVASPRFAVCSRLCAQSPRARAPLMRLAPAILWASAATAGRSCVAIAWSNAVMLAPVLDTKVCSRLAINACSLPNMLLSTLASNTGRPQASPLGMVCSEGFTGRMWVGSGYAGRGAASREVPDQFSARKRSTGLGEINAIIAICTEKQHPQAHEPRHSLFAGC